MKKFFLVSAIALMVFGLSTTAKADTTASAVAVILAHVNPNVSMTPVTAIVTAPTVQTGKFSATVIFTVDANVESLSLQVFASALFKGGITTLPLAVNPIPLSVVDGVLIGPASASRIDGLPITTPIAYDPVLSSTVNGFPTIGTDPVGYESSQKGDFSQNVTVVVTWNQGDPEQTTGDYQGVVKLVALLS